MTAAMVDGAEGGPILHLRVLQGEPVIQLRAADAVRVRHTAGHEILAPRPHFTTQQDTGEAYGTPGRHAQELALHLIPGGVDPDGAVVPLRIGGHILQQIPYPH